MKVCTIFLSIWLASSVAFSNGVIAPELPLVAAAKQRAEYPIIRRIQDLTLELQLLEITIKNRRDAELEGKISGAIQSIEAQGQKISERFKTIRAEQLEGLYGLFTLGKRYGELLGVAPIEWDELLGALRDGSITAGTLTVHSKAGVLALVNLTPLYIGKQLVWNVSPPQFDRRSFWVQARARARQLGWGPIPSLGDEAILARTSHLNASFGEAEQVTRAYFTQSYSRLYSAFEDHRYAILQRVQMVRKALIELEKTNTAMNTPEEYSVLYNQVLESLFAYGVDLSLSGTQDATRDFAIKGFLFAESPERSQELLKKLKYLPSSKSYNSPST